MRKPDTGYLYHRLLMSRLPEYVVFDLETNADRPDRAEHEIIQIGAVAAVGNGEVDTFEALVRPRRPLPARITELTGLVYGDLAGAPPLGRVLGEFFEWLGDRPLIAHNGFGYDFVVLDAAAAAEGIVVPAGDRLDTLELAHLVHPRAGSGIRSVDGTSPPPGRSLDHLAAAYDLAGRDRHDALVDSRMTWAVMLGLLEELDRDSPVRRLQRWILGVSAHPWAGFVQPQSRPPPLADVVPSVPVPGPIVPTGRFDAAAIVRAFRSGGRLMTGGRTPRAQQAEMAISVCRAFTTRGGRRMIEAPTGTGKTLAYLVPAIEMARASGRTAVVTPHSRVLQDQILTTLEQLETEIGPFTKVVLKGRQNYISLKSLDAELTGMEEESDRSPVRHPTAMALAILCGWVAETPSGDWADLRTRALEDHLTPLRFLRWRLRVDTRPGPVRDRLDALDFYRRASGTLRTAHVAVLNHALLATGPELGEGSFNLIVDEAHGLEDSVTSAATLQVEGEHLERICDALWDPETRRGLATRLAVATGVGLRDRRIDRIRRAGVEARAAIRRFSAPLTEYVRDRTGVRREEAARYGSSYRIRRGVDTYHPSYRTVLEAGRAMRRALREVTEALDAISVPEQLHGRYRRDALEDELARFGREISDAALLVHSVLSAAADMRLFDDDLSDHHLIDWINIAEVSFETSGRGRNGFEAVGGTAAEAGRSGQGEWRWALRRAPLSVAGLLSELWERSHSVLLTSATLRAGDDFGYLVGRLGLGSVESKVIDTPFGNLPENHLLLLTDYLPAPRGQLMDRFTETEATEIPRLCVASDGGALVLMTARARLDYVRDHARAHLGPLELELMAQGDGPSPALVERMRNDRDSCLLGLRSFWEGIDIPGEALRLLVVEKVPFDSIGDPVVGARSDLIEMRGRDPFADYMVPRAAIAFAQGVGRLIRTADDKGVTVVLDSRLRRPIPYRDVLLRGLTGPPSKREIDTPEAAYDAITDHLGLDLDRVRWERIRRIPGIETLSQAALEVGDDGSPDRPAIARRLERAREWLGFEEWRPGQHEVMTRFMRGEDVVAVLPTGFGKSVTYQVPALVSPGVTMVVSPLIALMRDQVDNLRARGVTEAAAIYSGVGQAEQQAILAGAAAGHIKLLYVSPERLWSPVFRTWLKEVDVARVAVDEAHCISLWGHSFRPEYAMIPRAVAEVTGARLPTLAVTATATSEVLEDIAALLDLRPSGRPLVGSVNRPEIRYYLERCRSRKDRDLRVIQVVEAFRRRSAIVYVPTRRDTTRLSGLLRTFGNRVRPYNGAMCYTERQHTEDAFRHGEIDVVVATKAFGLGIDKPDIALIVHLEMPASIEEYVQETGRVARGARDGTGPDIGTAVLLVTPNDCGIHEFFARSAVPELEDIERELAPLAVGMNYIDLARLSRRPGTEDAEPDQLRVLALHYLDRVGVLRRHRDFVLRGRVAPVEDTGRRLADLRTRDPESARKADDVLRLVEREGGEYRGLDWSSRLGMSPGEIEAVLFDMQKRDLCWFSSWKYGWVFERIEGVRPDRRHLDRLIRRRRRSVEDRARRARRLAHGRPDCRRREMLRYLGESDPFERGYSCGGCDACTPELPRPWAGTGIGVEQMREAVHEGADAIILVLIDDVEGGRWSRRNLVRTLRGEGGGLHPLPERLRLHSCFDRLGLLDPEEVEGMIDGMIRDGYLEEVRPGGRTYKTLRLTDDGRSLLRGRYSR